MDRPWTKWPINECGENLVKIPVSFFRLQPHPYVALGAPYQRIDAPYFLRKDVVRRLLAAQDELQRIDPETSLVIFDGWRPINVQAFMVEHAINQECESRGIAPLDPTKRFERKKAIESVKRFWAAPSFDPMTPPPHSTGGAVDITISDVNGRPLDMGSEIDQIGAISEPDYFSDLRQKIVTNKTRLFNYRRRILAIAMSKVGFLQHPNEWWHFSYGDQMWAFICNEREAIYGALSSIDNKSRTA
ncbi:M15 family metallopeptidase [Prochlorococcus sp. MIT 1300]|uniref:M15 family metallopeptidase n=1 Tax=Prochlorococcus sp. MIT 1300 TaxID=3096218 RepID=UPI002A74D06E|nr:M15 family metallopeptidase [Prochlorococcus sp. MIT 1300]